MSISTEKFAKAKVCILMPAYNEEAGLRATINTVSSKIIDLKQKELVCNESFMLFVDDGSDDSTWRIIQRAHDESPDLVRGVRLAANRGKENAMFAGIMVAMDQADTIICMDADLQFDIDALDHFLSMQAQGYELVYGVKKTRGSEPLYKQFFSRVFYSLMERLGSPIVMNHTDFCLLSHQVCEALAEYGETNIILRGLLKQLGFKQAPYYFEVKNRAAGESHYSPLKLLNLSLDAITSFSIVPLRLIVLVGGFVFLIGIGMITWTIGDVFHGNTPGGYPSLICSLWFLGGLGMICLGVAGEYLGKLYMEAKKRPRHYIAESLLKHN